MFCSLVNVATGQSRAGYVLSDEVAAAKMRGVRFPLQRLFEISDAPKHTAILKKETLLNPDNNAIQKLYREYPEGIAVELRTDDGKAVLLEMLKSNPLSSSPVMTYQDYTGQHLCSYERGAHYQGAINGNPKSIATLSVFSDGSVMAIFSNAEENYVLGKVADSSRLYILYNDNDFKVQIPGRCGVDDYSVYEKNEEENNKSTAIAAYECKKLRMYWEADYGLYKSKSSNITTVQNYMTGLFNNVQALYKNEKLTIVLNAVKVWTTNDGYDSTSSSGALTSFRNRWNSNGNNFDGDLAMLLARDNGGQGGIAYLDVLCQRTNAYAYGDVNGNYLSVPTYSWDVQMVTHEHGHNIGSKHTHWCGWMTGPGGTCGSIDDCTTKESATGCSNCIYEVKQNSQPATAWKGSIMSYCHLTGRGISLANGFDSLPGNKLRAEVGTKTCLQSVDSPKCWPSSVTIIKNGRQYVSLYPNPAHQNFSMKFFTEKAATITIKVADVVGKTTMLKTYAAKQGENDVTVDINGWTKGVYFVQIQSANEEYETVKLIVE